MNDAGNLALLGRVMGGLIVVLVLIGLAARVARRARGHKGTTGLRVIDRIGLSREANLTVVEVANRVLLLGVTAQGVTMLADLDAAASRDAGHQPDPAEAVAAGGGTGAGSPADGYAHADLDPGSDSPPAQPARRTGPTTRVQTRPDPEPGLVTDRLLVDAEPRSQRRPLPSGVALEEYPDLASALRAAGRTAGSTGSAGSARSAAAGGTSGTSAGSSATVPSPPGTAPRTRAEARAEARARASVAAQAEALAQASTPPSAAVPVPSTSTEIDRIPAPRKQAAAPGAKRPGPAPAAPASGSVLSPRTWRQGIEALRDLTVRRG